MPENRLAAPDRQDAASPPAGSNLQDAEWARRHYRCRDVKLVYYLAAKGEIPCVRIGRRVYFDPEMCREHVRRGGGAQIVRELQARRPPRHPASYPGIETPETPLAARSQE